MNPDFILLIIIAASTLLLAIAKTHIAFVILSLCTGFVLSHFVVGGSLSGQGDESSFVNIASHIGLILLPALLIGYRFRKTQKGIGRFLQQIIPALGLTSLAVVLILDALPKSTLDSLSEESYLVGTFEAFASPLVMFAVAIALFDVLVKHANEPIRKSRGPGRPCKH